MSIEMIEEEAFNQGTQIKVIGVGGGGGNAVAHMVNANVCQRRRIAEDSVEQIV